MAYQIIGVNEINTTVTPSIGLGVSFSSTSPIFKSIYLTTEQATENLKTLLLTRIGERYMEPNFGTNLLYIVFEPNVSQIKQEISDIITSAISHWLPYIEIDDLTIVTAEDDPNLQYNIQITLVFSVNGFDTKSITLSADNNGQLIVS
jgi:phage baseplate assembly protein W